MQKTSFRNRMLAELDRSGMTVAELSRRSGVPYDTLTKLKQRENASTSAENARAIATALGMSDYEPPTALLAPDEVEMIPLYDVAASAGYGTVVEYEPIIDRLSFPREYLRWLTKANPKYLQIISVKGDSMEPTLKDDDIVMLDASKTNLSYDGMFVVRFDGTLHVKRISRSSRPGFITIISDNRALYPERDWPQEEVDVLGKVIWYGRKV